MNIDTIEKIKYSRWYTGIQKNHRGMVKKYNLMSFDLETCYGRPFAMGFAVDDSKVSSSSPSYQLIYGKNKPYLSILLDLIRKNISKKATNILYGHFHSFDWGVLLWPLLYHDGELKSDRAVKDIYFSLWKERITIHFHFSNPAFGKIEFLSKGSKTVVSLIDTYAFFSFSLDDSLKILKSSIKKLKKPKHLGVEIIPKQKVEKYLEADTRGCLELGKYIMKMHEKWDVYPCISLPQMSSRIYRHCFLKTPIRKPYAAVKIMSLLSYHGGKNTFAAKPGEYYCTELDISSAYPHAMHELPNFEDGCGKYITVKKYTSPHGIYCVSGYVKSCKWPIFFDDVFKKVEGNISEIWVTGYELKEALDSEEFIPARILGYVWKPYKNAPESSLSKFVEIMYEKKETAETPTEKIFYKLLLNSLYGKFIQKTELDDGTYIAGSMQHSFIATLITGFVRARIHKLEHSYQSLHTATDSIVTTMPIVEGDLGIGLGSLKKEITGNCIILRNKLYLHYNEKGRLKKWGLHGFQGSPVQMLKLYKTGERLYTKKRLIKWSESFHIGLPPGLAVTRKLELRI